MSVRQHPIGDRGWPRDRGFPLGQVGLDRDELWRAAGVDRL